ncbi:hypothetical protein [Merdimonas faecis]|uniref:hypothetical protein n=1 Tax=Merdimonas faecis TaxID=1653435 RepID=UPI0022E03FA2|nr:hypothetical protein [Merdimonas faecis]
MKIKALWLVLFVFDPKQREFQSYNAICADGSVTEEMPDQKRIIFEHRAVICRQEKSWLAGNRSFLFLPLLAEAETMQCKEVV